MSPLVMSSSPTIIRSSVDLPQPDGPTRIMNSPSAMSRLTSFTAGKPSPYCLTMWFIWISAISTSPSGGGFGCARSALHSAVGEAGDDAPLEQQHEGDDRDGDDHRGCRDGAGGVLELRGAGEQAQRRRHRAGGVRRGQRDAVDEVVPSDEEGDDRRGEHPGGGRRHDHLAERLPRRRPVDLGGLLHLPGDLPEERRHGPDRDRQGPRQGGGAPAGRGGGGGG